MISALEAPSKGSWRRILAQGVSRPQELLQLLDLDPAAVGFDDPRTEQARGQFPQRVPRGFVDRMRPGDPRDPLLLQVLPRAVEMEPVPGFSADPLGEAAASPRPGLLHKYAGRVLVVVTGACGVHCRYCFRRHFPYGQHLLGPAERERIISYVAEDPSITEVILSGGDPLTLADDKLAPLVRELAEVAHLMRLRVHSRMPVVLPERVDEGLVEWLAGTRLRPVMVIHANHSREIDESVAAAIDRLRQAGVTVLNQAVLLAGVNDDAGALEDLSERLFEVGVLPYYLHLLDPVTGAAHFEVPEDRARRIARELTARLPGYLVPKLVREVPGAAAKVPVDLRVEPQRPEP